MLRKRNYSTYAKKKSLAKKITKYRSKIPRELSNDRVHFVKRFADGGSFTVANSVYLGVARSFALNQIPGFAELTALYDQYKICGVKIQFIPPFDNRDNLATVDSPNISSRFYTAIDYNDSTPPLSLDELRQYENAKMTTVNEKHVRYIPAPKFLNNSGQNVNDWISTGNPNTAHYGIKFGIEPTLQTGIINYLVNTEYTFYLCFRNIK